MWHCIFNKKLWERLFTKPWLYTSLTNPFGRFHFDKQTTWKTDVWLWRSLKIICHSHKMELTLLSFVQIIHRITRLCIITTKSCCLSYCAIFLITSSWLGWCAALSQCSLEQPQRGGFHCRAWAIPTDSRAQPSALCTLHNEMQHRTPEMEILDILHKTKGTAFILQLNTF